MKKKKYLPLYEFLVKHGSLTGPHGLCNEFHINGLDWKEFEDLFKPPNDIDRLYHHFYWGSGSFQYQALGEFTPLRQNILLLMAALNDEL